jgi:hypothetical protein
MGKKMVLMEGWVDENGQAKVWFTASNPKEQEALNRRIRLAIKKARRKSPTFAQWSKKVGSP